MRKTIFSAALLVIAMGFGLIVNAQCINYPANAGSNPAVTYNFAGGSFQSYGCAPIDPTYWVSGSGPNITMTFSTPQNSPRFRVWGMNTDDIASVQVNGSPYALNAVSAYELPKVVCGISPGPLGVVFSGGNLVGGNTPAQGNYSYSDVVLSTSGVNSIRVTAIAGAGWGFASTSLNCVVPLDASNYFTTSSPEAPQKDVVVWPNPIQDVLNLSFSESFCPNQIALYDGNGKKIFELTELQNEMQLDCSTIKSGIYWLKIRNAKGVVETQCLKKL